MESVEIISNNNPENSGCPEKVRLLSEKSSEDFPGHKAAQTGNFRDFYSHVERNPGHFNPFLQDFNLRTVLHYAVSYGNQDAALWMVNLTLDSQFFKESENLNSQTKLLNVQDKQGETALHLAAKSRHRQICQHLLTAGADFNIKSTDGKEPIELIYKYVPQVMSDGFDKAISFTDGDGNDGDNCDDNFEVELDFGPIIGYPGDDELNKEYDGFCEVETKHLIKALDGNEKKCGKILVHPLVQMFLRTKWSKIRFLFLTSILFHLVWLIVYSAFILNLYVLKCPYITNKTVSSDEKISTFEDGSVGIECSAELGNIHGFSLISLIAITIFVGFKEVYEMTSLPDLKTYFLDLENIGQIMQIIFIVLTSWPALTSVNAEFIQLLPWHYQSAAFGVLLAWTLILSQIGQAPQLSIYVQILKKVLKSFGMFMLTFVSLLAGFAFSFSILIPKSEMFRPHLAISKVLTMMTGELNYNELFYDNEDKDFMPFVLSGHILFATFTIIVTIILFNLLIGFTVSDIQGLQTKAQVSKLSNQLEQIYLMESFLFSKNMLFMIRVLRLDDIFRKAFLITPFLSRVGAGEGVRPMARKFTSKTIASQLIKDVSKLAARNLASENERFTKNMIFEGEELRKEIDNIKLKLDQLLQLNKIDNE